jgi:GNAT superfamily N-acetyltransferase
MRYYEICNEDDLDQSFKELKVGKATLQYRFLKSNMIELASVRVPQKYRGQGLAKAALQQLCDLADQHTAAIELAASPLDKKTATNGLIALYSKFGFVKTGRTINVIGDPYMIRPATQRRI